MWRHQLARVRMRRQLSPAKPPPIIGGVIIILGGIMGRYPPPMPMPDLKDFTFSEGGPKAWFVVARRTR